ncbi:MAG: cytochrome d ubiquinol oxidase subunit II [Bacteroidales bacterium]|nr:cytochrome d ubiquinol oxidase subunit II [Bacteroidales bacterium]
MTTYHFLQLYWWAIVSILGAVLVFLTFVQGGQTLLWGTAKNEDEKRILLTIFGHKWELTFTTLVTFGGAAFASFPLFYSTSFGGAYWLWILILISFVIQSFSYEFRARERNLLGKKTYETFLMINGIVGTILLGVAVATFISGGNYAMDKMNITTGSSNIISYWTNNYRGLELIFKPFNLLLGVVVFLAARTLGLLFTFNQCSKMEGDAARNLANRALSKVKVTGVGFVLFFVAFVVCLFLSTGYRVDTASDSFNGINGPIVEEKFAYLHNMLNQWWIAAIFLIGVVLVLIALGRTMLKEKSSFYTAGLGVVLAVFAILLTIGFADMAYFHSLYDINSSLTLYNSSSSLYTLKTMAWVSLAVPFVILYIAYVWRKMTQK